MNHVQGMVLLSVFYCASTGSLDGSLKTQAPQAHVHVALPTSSGVGKEFSPKDISVDKVIGALKGIKEGFNYLSDSIIIPFPTIPGLAGFGSGWALEVNWGFSGSGSILDGSFPPLRMVPRNLSSPDIERNIQLGSQLAQLALGTQHANAFDAFEAAQKGQARQDGPLGGILSFLNVDAADNPWIVYGLKVLALLKYSAQHNVGPLKAAKTNSSETDDFMLMQKNVKFLDILREFTRLSLRLFFSLKVSMSNVQNQAILDFAPDWVRDSMSKLSVLIQREPAYLEGFINNMWHDVWRYYNVSFDNKGRMHNVGPAVIGIRFENGQDASEYQRLWSENSRIFASKSVDYSAKFFAQFFQRQAQIVAPADAQKGGRLQELANNVLSKAAYQDFGLIDKDDKKGVPAEFYKAAVQHKPASLFPAVVSVPLKSPIGTEHWVLFITNTLNFRETLKIMGAVMLQGGVKVAKAWDRAKSGNIKQEYAAIIKAEVDLKRREHENGLFLKLADDQSSSLAALASYSKVVVESQLDTHKTFTLTNVSWARVPEPGTQELMSVAKLNEVNAQKRVIKDDLSTVKQKLGFVKKMTSVTEDVITQLKGESQGLLEGLVKQFVVSKDFGSAVLPKDIENRLGSVEEFINRYSGRNLGRFNYPLRNGAEFIQEFIGIRFSTLSEDARRKLAEKLTEFKDKLGKQRTTLQEEQGELNKNKGELGQKQFETIKGKIEEVFSWNDPYVAKDEDMCVVILRELASDFDRAQAHLTRLNSEGGHVKSLQKQLGQAGGLSKHTTDLVERVITALDTMSFFAEKMGKNAEKYLALQKKVYATEQDRLRKEQKGVDKGDSDKDKSMKLMKHIKLLWSRIDYLGDKIVMVESQQLEFESRERTMSVSKHKYEQLKLNTAFFENGKAKPAILDQADLRSYAATVVSFAEYIQWLINYTAALDTQRSFWSRTNEQYKAYWESIRAKVPEFKQVRQELINHIGILFNMSPALQQAPKVAIWFFEVFFESILGRITEQDIAQLERKDIIALSAEDALALQASDETSISSAPTGSVQQRP